MPPEIIRCPQCDTQVRIRSDASKKTWKCPKCKTPLRSAADPEPAPSGVPFIATYFAQFVLGLMVVILSAAIPYAFLWLLPKEMQNPVIVGLAFVFMPMVCAFACLVALFPFSSRMVGRIMYYKISTFFPYETTETSKSYRTPMFGKKATAKAAMLNTIYWFRGWVLLGCVLGSVYGATEATTPNNDLPLGVAGAIVGAIVVRFAITMFMMDFVSEIAPEELQDYRRVLDSGPSEEQVAKGPGSSSIEFGWLGWLVWS